MDSERGSGENGQRAAKLLAGLAADDYGYSDHRPPLVLLHGLTFDRSTWRPALTELHHIDPGRRLLAFDLPGHGASPPWPSYDLESIADRLHLAVEEAQLNAPIIVGHSIAAIIATIYGARYPTGGIINVDQSLQTAPFAGLLHSVADKLRGPAFPDIWDMFMASMHVELLPESAQRLVRASCHPRQELVLGYWRELLDRPVDEIAEIATAAMTAVRVSGVPYLLVAGSDLEPDYQLWLNEMLSQASVTVWPGSGHFPQLAHPDRFAACLAATALWAADAAGNTPVKGHNLTFEISDGLMA
jgi:pimeloyl-ACP methyl ester carboxylesterase